MRRNEASMNQDLVRELSRCADACRASELSCTIAIDVVRKKLTSADAARPARVLRSCATRCSATASDLASMRSLDLDAVAHALHSCRLACRAAHSVCRRGPFDACCAECAQVCRECAALCESLLTRASLVAA